MREHTMTPKQHPITPKVAGVCSTLCLVAALIGGCTGSKVRGPRTQSPQRVAINDFVNPNAETNTAQSDQSDQTDINSTLISEPEETTPRDDGITLSSSPANRKNQPYRPQGDDLARNTASNESSSIVSSDHLAGSTDRNSTTKLSLLDAKVGDVNGKPIFTNSFFEPIDDRLIAEAGRLSPANWRRSAGTIIANRLDGIIADELLRAEALASLTPNQRVGLQAFLGKFRNNLLSQNLGSSQLASRRLQQEQGQTLDEALKQKEVDTLVQLTLIKEINRRVNVSWRDIKQRYERDIDEFSPPPTAVFRVIRAFKDDKEKISEIQKQLDNGTDFLKVAAGPLNNFNTDADGLHEVQIEESYETTKFFGPDILNEATQKLHVGEAIGPIELGSSVYWIKLMNMKQESISLYDAQRKILIDLTAERKQEAYEQYLKGLNERARVSSRDEVLLRLLQIAEERYGPKS